MQGKQAAPSEQLLALQEGRQALRAALRLVSLQGLQPAPWAPFSEAWQGQ